MPKLQKLITSEQLEKRLLEFENKIKSSSMQIQTGVLEFDKSWSFVEHKKYWSFFKTVKFLNSFHFPPKIFLSVTGIEQGDSSDLITYTGYLVEVIENSITKDEFRVELSTYWNEEPCWINECRVEWLAILDPNLKTE